MNKKGLLYVIIASLLWGTSGIFVRYLTPLGFSSLQMTAIRAVISSLGMAGYVFFKDKSLFKTNPKALVLFIAGGFSMYMTALFYYMSMQESSIATAVVLMYTAPVFVMIYSVIFLGERFSAAKGVSLVGMLIGCALISGIVGDARFNAKGIFFGALSGITYSIYNILAKIQMRQNNNPVTTSLYCFIFMAVAAVSLGNVPGIIETVGQNPMGSLPLVLGLGVVTCLLPYFFYTKAMEKLSAGIASSLGIMEPVAATFYGLVIFGEWPGIFGAIGFVCVLGAVLLLSRCEG